MPGNHNIGDDVAFEFNERYVEPFPGDESKVMYAKDSDRMSAFYDYYIFDAAEFQKNILEDKYWKKLLARGDVFSLRFTVTGKRNQRDAGDAKGARPEGGFSKTYYECKDVEGEDFREENFRE